MSLSTEQFMALSALSYTDLRGARGLTINDIIHDSDKGLRPIKDYRGINNTINPQFSHLAELGSFTLDPLMTHTDESLKVR